MADRFPLILNTNINQIQEIASGDNLDLTGSGIHNAGVITATSFSGPIVAGVGVSNITSGIGTFTDLRVGGDSSFSEDLVVTGNARVTGILTVGTSSIILNDSANTIKVGTALTLGHTQGLQFHTQNLHSTGFEVNQINASGIITATGADINGDIDVDGHTNLDNVSIAGVTTFAGAIDANGDLDVDGHTNLDNVSIAGVTTMSGNVRIQNASPILYLTDTGNNPDYQIKNNNGYLDIFDETNTATRLSISNTGAITTGDHITLSGVNPRITFTDSNHNPDFEIYGSAGNFKIWDSTSNVGRLVVNSDGHIDIPGNLDCGAGIDVTGNITATGNVSGVDGTFTGNVSIGGTLTYEDVTNIDSVGIVTARDHINIVTDNKKLRIGASQDLELYHDGSHSHLVSNTGNLRILADGSGQLVLTSKAGEESIVCSQDGAVEIMHDNSRKFFTISNGVQATNRIIVGEGNAQRGILSGDANSVSVGSISDIPLNFNRNSQIKARIDGNDFQIPNDNGKIELGASQDLSIYHNGSNSYIKNSTNSLFINSAAHTYFGNADNSEYKAKFHNNGSVELYHDNVKRLETTSSGVTVTGTINFGSGMGSGLNSNGFNINFADSNGSQDMAKFGDSGDLKIYHQSNSSYIINSTGNLNIGSNNQIRIKGGSDVAESMAVFADNGSVELYYDNVKHFETISAGLNFAGSNADQLQWQKSNNLLKFRDGTKAVFGEGNDLQIYGGEGGTGAVINSANGDLFFRHGTEEQLILRDDGAVELYHNNVKKLETYANGVVVTGTVATGDFEVQVNSVAATISTGHQDNPAGIVTLTVSPVMLTLTSLTLTATPSRRPSRRPS